MAADLDPGIAAATRASPVAQVNPVRGAADWEAMRAAVLADPGGFHGAHAAQALH